MLDFPEIFSVRPKEQNKIPPTRFVGLATLLTSGLKLLQVFEITFMYGTRDVECVATWPRWGGELNEGGMNRHMMVLIVS